MLVKGGVWDCAYSACMLASNIHLQRESYTLIKLKAYDKDREYELKIPSVIYLSLAVSTAYDVTVFKSVKTFTVAIIWLVLHYMK